MRGWRSTYARVCQSLELVSLDLEISLPGLCVVMGGTGGGGYAEEGMRRICELVAASAGMATASMSAANSGATNCELLVVEGA